jgi:hypothetical protein
MDTQEKYIKVSDLDDAIENVYRKVNSYRLLYVNNKELREDFEAISKCVYANIGNLKKKASESKPSDDAAFFLTESMQKGAAIHAPACFLPPKMIMKN